MNGKAISEISGLPSRVFVPRAEAPIDSFRGLMELEMEKGRLSLNADVQSVIYLHQRGVRIAY